MRFKDKVKLSQEYAEWLKTENEKNDFMMPFNPETFLTFLDAKGMLKEPKATTCYKMCNRWKKTGHWERHEWDEPNNYTLMPYYKCSCCEALGSDTYKYCPHCGAEMEVLDETNN